MLEVVAAPTNRAPTLPVLLRLLWASLCTPFFTARIDAELWPDGPSVGKTSLYQVVVHFCCYSRVTKNKGAFEHIRYEDKSIARRACIMSSCWQLEGSWFRNHGVCDSQRKTVVFYYLEYTKTEGCLKCMFTKIFKQLNVILKEKGNNNYFHLFL